MIFGEIPTRLSRHAFRAALRRIMEEAGAVGGTMPLPIFLQACEAANLPCRPKAWSRPAVMAFQEVKTAVQQRLQSHAHLAEYGTELPKIAVSCDDNFEYPRFDEFTYPSADLQLAAGSAEAVARGDYRWVSAEVHPAAALLHHCMYWACPDKPA